MRFRYSFRSCTRMSSRRTRFADRAIASVAVAAWFSGLQHPVMRESGQSAFWIVWMCTARDGCEYLHHEARHHGNSIMGGLSHRCFARPSTWVLCGLTAVMRSGFAPEDTHAQRAVIKLHMWAPSYMGVSAVTATLARKSLDCSSRDHAVVYRSAAPRRRGTAACDLHPQHERIQLMSSPQASPRSAAAGLPRAIGAVPSLVCAGSAVPGDDDSKAL